MNAPQPAPPADRCCMGYPLGQEMTCWNSAPFPDLWCPTCAAEIAGKGPGCKCPGCTAAYEFNAAHSKQEAS